MTKPAERNFVVRLFFNNGSHEQVKYESQTEAMTAYNAIAAAVENRNYMGELTLHDGTKCSFRVGRLVYWKVFRYTEPSKEERNH